jgi:hypothetical protein
VPAVGAAVTAPTASERLGLVGVIVIVVGVDVGGGEGGVHLVVCVWVDAWIRQWRILGWHKVSEGVRLSWKCA